MEKSNPDVESAKPTKINHFRQVFDQGALTPEIINAEYPGSGTQDDPYIVTWLDHDPRNPMNYTSLTKWLLVILVSFATLAIAFVSSAYSGAVAQILIQFHTSEEVAILGVSLFVLGFAIGPLLWAPMSELYGRQYLYIGTYAAVTAFNAGACGSKNIQTLVILRFFAGAFGSSPLTNVGGVIADMFPARQRGVAMSLFAAAPFLGPTLGPIVGGFVGETIGWKWIEGIMAIFTGVLWLIGWLFMPETYAPVLLRKRAAKLTQVTGQVYSSKLDAEQGKVSAAHAFKTNLSRPWILLLREPIVFLLSVYMAIVYGTLYMLFAAYPIVYQEVRGWSQGIGGLAFLGVMIGMLFAIAYTLWDNKRYIRSCDSSPGGFAPPEARLPPVMIGGLTIPIGLFWFAWTNGRSVHYLASIAAGAPFGFGMVLVFLGIMNYLIDSYVIFAASVLAANSVLRSLFGAVFPLFTTYMYHNLGIHWASSIPAFLALACTPFPFLFYKYGPQIRIRCKFAAEADAFLKKMRGQAVNKDEEPDSNESTSEDGPEDPEKFRRGSSRTEEEAEKEAEAIDYSYDIETDATRRDLTGEEMGTRLEPIKSVAMVNPVAAKTGDYEDNPFDLDRVNTASSFPEKSMTASRVNSNNASRAGSRASSPPRSLKSKSSKNLKKKSSHQLGSKASQKELSKELSRNQVSK